MNLTEEAEIVEWPETHYVFVEKVGPFMKTAPEAWGQLHGQVAGIEESNRITGYFSLYKRGPNIYRAGVSVAEAPAALPEGLQYERFSGGKYSRFVLTGPYTQLPAASGRAWDIAAERKLPLRDGFAIESYLRDPRTTPAAELVTEILLPMV